MIKVNIIRKTPGSLKGVFDRICSKYTKKFEAGLEEAAGILLREAKRLCPVDTGALRASGKIRRAVTPRFRPFRVNVEFIVEFGRMDYYHTAYTTNPNYPRRLRKQHPYTYAVFVHENRDIAYRNGQAGFLETAALTKESDMIAAINRHGIP